MAILSPQGPFRAFDSNGDPLAGGKLYTYVAGTSTPKDTFTDESGDTANTNPVILDANGYADVWLGDGAYKFVLDDAADVNQWTLDDIAGDVAAGFASNVIDVSTSTLINETYLNSVVRCTAAVTLSLLDVTTAGNGFVFSVRNDSAGDVTIDPDGAENIDGSATLTVTAGNSATIVCNGTEWFSLFLAPEVPVPTVQAPVRVSLSADQTVSAANVWDTIEFDSVDFDDDDIYDETTNYRLTPTVEGYYRITYSLLFTGATQDSDNIYSRILKNGTDGIGETLTRFVTSGIQHLGNTDLVYFNGTTDYINLQFRSSDASATLDVAAVQQDIWFTAEYIYQV
jgi:hypothetical protein